MSRKRAIFVSRTARVRPRIVYVTKWHANAHRRLTSDYKGLPRLCDTMARPWPRQDGPVPRRRHGPHRAPVAGPGVHREARAHPRHLRLPDRAGADRRLDAADPGAARTGPADGDCAGALLDPGSGALGHP